MAWSIRSATCRWACAAGGRRPRTWPGRRTWASPPSSCTDVERDGIDSVVDSAIEVLGAGPVFLTVDVDVLDPAFAPGTGTPEPGGLTPAQLLKACLRAGRDLDLIGADVVETLPLTVEDATALIANRIVASVLAGIASRAARRRRVISRVRGW